MSESVDYAFYKVAVAERDHERVVNARLSVEKSGVFVKENQ